MKRAVLTALMLLLTVTAGHAEETGWVERRVGDLGVILPTGGDWELGPSDSGGWIAVRVQRDPVDQPEFVHAVAVEPNQLPEIFSDWLPVEVSTDYLLWEIENMQTEGVKKGQYDLIDIDVYEEKHGEKTLHVLRNVKSFIQPWHPMLSLEAQELYLVFPSNFSDTTTFYKIFLTADCFFQTCEVGDLQLSELYKILDKVHDYSKTQE